MSKLNRFRIMMAGATMFAGAMSFAQSGEAIYKAKCQSCHGAAGIPSPGMAKAMGVKPITDPAVMKSSKTEMIKATENGMGKMRPYKGQLSDAEIKASVEYFRSFMKK